MNAIISAATGYKEEQLQNFLWSIKKNCPDTQVFLIAYECDRPIVEPLRAKFPFLQPVYISLSLRQLAAKLEDNRTRPTLVWLARQLSKFPFTALPAALSFPFQIATKIIHERYFIALRLLQSKCKLFENVLWTDCRDVVIQRDPFRLVNGQLISGLEPEIIKNEKFTAGWIEDAYGQEVLQSLCEQTVVCAGVTLGPAAKMEAYLASICNEMWTHLPELLFKNVGYDQAAHIYLIYRGKIDLMLTSNQQEIINTISMENPQNFCVEKAKGLLKVYNHYPAIVHQYDRHPELLDFFDGLASEQFDFEPNPEMAQRKG